MLAKKQIRMQVINQTLWAKISAEVLCNVYAKIPLEINEIRQSEIEESEKAIKDQNILEKWDVIFRSC